MNINNTSLDPEDWEEVEAAFQQILKISIAHYQTLASQPVWQPTPKIVKEQFRKPLPRKPQSIDQIIDCYSNFLLPYGNGNLHPRFYGWLHGAGNLYGALGEFSAALINANLGGRDHVAHHIEEQVLSWSKNLLGFPANSSGLLTSGTSLATLIALAVARQRAGGVKIKTEGLQGYRSALVGYCSTQGHNSLIKAFQLLGLGSSALRMIKVREDFTLDPQALIQQITNDRAAGYTPFCVIATVGTVNTGALDDVRQIAQICQTEGLWLHVDAAFGSALALLEERCSALAGVEDADSIAFDFHKWFQVPYAVGVVLIRDAALHQATFSERKEYLASYALGLGGGEPWRCDFGPELSRGFLALKVWFSFQALGSDRFAEIIRKHCRIAQNTATQIDQEADLELMAPVTLNILCLRYLPLRLMGAEEISEEALREDCNRLNEAIVTALQLQGLAAPSTTVLNGKLVIRVSITNHRTEQADVDALISQIRLLGERIVTHFYALLKPTHWHLTQGGDARLLVDPTTGLNRYGCSPIPREAAFTFASSTATSISTVAYASAENEHQRLLHALVQAERYAPLVETTRFVEMQIAECFALSDLGVDIHLTPSGTDAQLQAVAAITTAHPATWVSLVCGADETGSGTPYSVTGCHFDMATCLNISVTRGQRLAGMPAIGLLQLDFRSTTGKMKLPSELDEEIWSAVDAQIQQGRSVMVHAMDHSKCGCWAPSPDLLNRLRQTYGGRLQVIVDACQMRLDVPDLHDHLLKGDIVLITGSKFFTGPPFSGAVIYPAGFTEHLLQSAQALPVGLLDYLPQAELGRWEPLLLHARQPLAIGLLLRWQAALTEIRRYTQVPETQRCAGLDRFASEVMAMLQGYAQIEPIFDPASPWWARTAMYGTELSIRRTIFPFLLRNAQGQHLTQEQVRWVYEQLNTDLRHCAGSHPQQQALAAQCCHIGQPVKVPATNTALLRISAGARVFSDSWHDGRYDAGHLDEEFYQVRMILDKVQWCLQRRSHSAA